jgi:asparagine synthase (glutamine-hydrolysing)
MSAILAVVAPAGALPSEVVVRQMLAAMRPRGIEETAIRRVDGAVLAVGRYGWETPVEIAGPAEVAEDGGLHVVADARLYHRAALERELRGAGVRPRGTSAAQLVAAAYRAWGEQSIARLEGDFAFLLWDAERGLLLGARDFVGTRPLFHAVAGESLVVASGIGGVLAHPAVDGELNLAALAETATFILIPREETSFRAVRSLPAGTVLQGGRGVAPRVTRFWSAPTFLGEADPEIPFEEAAEELGRLLRSATAERMAIDSPTAVTLSGGWDSPSIYAAAHAVCRERGTPADAVVPVSISFPEGDTGREDDVIERITAQYGQRSRWIDIADIPLFPADFEARTRAADDPYVHIFSEFNRALARSSAAAGPKVVLNGGGGDHLFHADPAYLSDLLCSGRWISFLREWRAEGLRGWDALRDWVLRPLLGERARRAVASLRGGPVPAGYLERSLPSWIEPAFARREDLHGRIRKHVPQRRPGERAEDMEHRWMLEHPGYPRVLSAVHAISLECGVDQRAPLLDGRVVAFAASRPRRERRSGRETKRLLRAAVRDLLPPEVLAPRKERTGTTLSYFQRSMMTSFGPRALPWLKDPILAQLGIVNVKRLHQACAAAERGRLAEETNALVLTLNAELWLRSRVDDGGGTAEAGASRASERDERTLVVSP